MVPSQPTLPTNHALLVQFCAQSPETPMAWVGRRRRILSSRKNGCCDQGRRFENMLLLYISQTTPGYLAQHHDRVVLDIYGVVG